MGTPLRRMLSLTSDRGGPFDDGASGEKSEAVARGIRLFVGRRKEGAVRTALSAEALDMLFLEARTHRAWLDYPVSDEI